MAGDSYDALLLVSFGGPEGPEDVLPFLENVLRGRNVPQQRMLEVAEHYQHFGGVSPINAQNRALIEALERRFADDGPSLPIYFGNRNWHPMLPETLHQMREDGIRQALAFFTSPYSSYSSCRQYRENIEAARRQVGGGVPSVEKLRVYFNHPGFIEPMQRKLREALEQVPIERRDAALVLFTAHSIPTAMAQQCRYEAQLQEASRLVAGVLNGNRWQLVYQSRSGPPSQPWLEPDVCDVIREAASTTRDVVLVPIGFISDHMEVLYDLDLEARQVSDESGVHMVRCETVGTDPAFIEMIRELVIERLDPSSRRRALGNEGPSHDICPVDCCLYTPQRPPVAGH